MLSSTRFRNESMGIKMFKTNLLKLTLGLAFLITATAATAQDRYWKKTRSPDGSGAFYESVASGLYEGEYAHLFLPITGEPYRQALYLHELSKSERKSRKAREVEGRLVETLVNAYRRDKSSRLGRVYATCAKENRDLDRMADMIFSDDNPYTPENYDPDSELTMPVNCLVRRVMKWSSARLRVALRTDFYARKHDVDLPGIARVTLFDSDYGAVQLPKQDTNAFMYESWYRGSKSECFKTVKEARDYSEVLLDPKRKPEHRAEFDAEQLCRISKQKGIVFAIGTLWLRADHLKRELNRTNSPFHGVGVTFYYKDIKDNRVRINFRNLGSLIRKEL